MIAVLRFTNVLHLHQEVCHSIGKTIVRTSRFTLLKIFLACDSFHQLPIRSEATILRRKRSCYGSLVLVFVGPACLLLPQLSTVPLAEFSVLLPQTFSWRASSSNLQFDISRIDPPHVSFTGHCISLDYGPLNCQPLVC